MTIASRVRRFWINLDGVSAVEFSLLLPLLLALFLGGFVIAKTIAISRKLTITTRALADLTSQYKTMTAADIATVMTASTQILAPFDSTPLGIRLSEIQLDVTGLIATVTFSKVSGTQFTPYKAGTIFLNLPSNLPSTPNAAYILAETSYTYSVVSNVRFAPPVSLNDRIYMLPRLSANVTYTGS